MNLNDQSINKSLISQSVEEFYAFPDRLKMRQHVYGERLMTREEHAKQTKHYNRVGLFLAVSTSISGCAYCFLLMPGGKVLRDLKDAQQTPFRRVMKRVIPFVFLALPIIYIRGIIDRSQNKYKDTE